MSHPDHFVITRAEFTMKKALDVLKDETIAVIGYGVQGPTQGLNMHDNGFNVIVGQAKQFERDWGRAVQDGWIPGETLFDMEEAAQRGTIVQMLVSDAAQQFKAAVLPVFKNLYERVASGVETKRVLETGSNPDYQQGLAKELSEIGNSEMWLAGKATRSLRPKELAREITEATKGVGGRQY